MKGMLSLLLVSMIVTAAQATYARVGRTIFVQDTDHAVFKGIMKGKVIYSYVVPCKLDTSSEDWNSPNNVKRVSAERFKRECNQEVSRAITPALTRISKCLPKNKQRAKVRGKRMVDPITLGVLATVVGASGGGSAAYSWLSSGSSYNRLNEKDIVDANQTSEINLLKAVVKKQEEELKRAQEVREETLTVSEKHLKLIEGNRNATIHLAEYGSHIAWQSASNHYVIKADQAYLQALADSCQKERLSTNAISKLTGVLEFNDWDESDTYVEQVDRIDNTTFSIDYHEFLRAIDTKIYEVADFKIWGDIFNKPVPQVYIGPPFALHNSTNNCTLGLDVLKKGRVFSNCSIENYRYPRLDEFEVVETSEEYAGESIKPTVYQNHAGSFIYCFQYKIKIGDRLQECPSYPFYLPILTPFSLLNTTHEVMELNVVQLKGQIEPLSRTVAAIGKDEEIEELNKAVVNLFNKNRMVREHDKAVESYPNRSQLILPPIVGAVSLSLGLVVAFIASKLCTRSASSEPAVTNNIYNSTPGQQFLPQQTYALKDQNSPPPIPAHYYPRPHIYSMAE